MYFSSLSEDVQKFFLGRCQNGETYDHENWWRCKTSASLCHSSYSDIRILSRVSNDSKGLGMVAEARLPVALPYIDQISWDVWFSSFELQKLLDMTSTDRQCKSRWHLAVLQSSG